MTETKHRPSYLSASKEYVAWYNMRLRCNNQRNKSWKNYGGRGIKVAPEWDCVGGFDAFLAHIGPAPTPKHSVDRIDNKGDYAPGNVRWATNKEQCRNTRRTVPIELAEAIKASPLCEKHAAKHFGVSYPTVKAVRSSDNSWRPSSPEVKPDLDSKPVGYRYLYETSEGLIWLFSGGGVVNNCMPVRSEPVYAGPHVFAEVELLNQLAAKDAELALVRGERDGKMLVITQLETQLAAATKRLKSAEAVIAFYKGSWRFSKNKQYGGLEWAPTESLLDDCGNRAAAFLASNPTPEDAR